VISQKVEANSEAIANLGHQIDANTQMMATFTQRMDLISQEMKDEVRWWDERFFKFAEDSANRANTLIASATIAVIAGVLLLIFNSRDAATGETPGDPGDSDRGRDLPPGSSAARSGCTVPPVHAELGQKRLARTD